MSESPVLFRATRFLSHLFLVQIFFVGVLAVIGFVVGKGEDPLWVVRPSRRAPTPTPCSVSLGHRQGSAFEVFHIRIPSWH